MSDFDSFRREVGAQVLPPDFEDVVAVGRRRRLSAVAWSAASVAAVVGVVALGMQGGYGDQSAPVAPANPTHSPSVTPSPTAWTSSQHRVSPTQVVQARSSSIAAVAISDASPNVKAVAWRYCLDGRDCIRQQFALTVTSDNFATSHDVDLPDRFRFYPLVFPVSDHAFYASSGAQPRLVDTDGTVRDVTMTTTARPIAAGELFVGQAANRSHVYLAVDPRTAIAHPVPLPPQGAPFSLDQSTDGTLVGLVFRVTESAITVVWSTDGGASWRQHPLAANGSDVVNTIPSTSTQPVLAVVQGGDGPSYTLHRSTDGGATWQTFDLDPGGLNLAWALIDQDGSLLVDYEAGAGRGQRRRQPVGLYESHGADWTQLQYVQDLPAPGGGIVLADYSPTAQGYLRIWAYRPSSGRLYESGPGIDTWAEVPSR